MSLHTYKPETRRVDRCVNIARAIILLNDDGDASGIGTERLRDEIRNELGLPKLTGEARLGDLRAHGDAIGGHGLGLEVLLDRTGGKKRRFIPLTEANVEKCKQYLLADETRDGVILY